MNQTKPIPQPENALALSGICKYFGPVKANDAIELTIKSGDIHGIIGENGAGKSTLVSMIYGFYQADRGELRVNGQLVDMRNSQQAIALGIGMVHQHFMLIDTFSVLENIILGAEGGALLKDSEQATRDKLEALASEYGLEVPLDEIVENLSVGMQQRIEILKALFRGAEILILDEPTGVLTPQETDDLFRVLRSLKERGVTILLITHKLREIMAITDQVSVMRQGTMVAHRETANTDTAELAELMVGRKVVQTIEKPHIEQGSVALEVSNLSMRDHKGVERVKGISFNIHAGEIVGIAGVSGNGQSQLLKALSGMERINGGSITVGDVEITPSSPKNPAQLRKAGLAHVPEDRQKAGLVLAFNAYESAVLGYHNAEKYNDQVIMNKSEMLTEYAQRAHSFDVRPEDPMLKTANFSGGNQQKIVLAREMEVNPDVLLIGQPTRGVDIGAIEFIHKRIMAMRNHGKAILLVSVELEEIMSLADRILVMCDGEITGEVRAEDADEQTLGLMMANAAEAAST